MSEDTSQTESTESQETEKAHDYDQKYAFDANSGLAPQPGGSALPADGPVELLVDSEGALKSVEGTDVTSQAQQAKIDAKAEGKSPEETAKAVKETEGATDEATKDKGDIGGDPDAKGETTPADEKTSGQEVKETTTAKAPATTAAAKKAADKK